MANESAVLRSMHDAGVKPGTYMFPNCTTMREMVEPDMVAKYERGPVGYLTVVPSGPPTMGGKLLSWFLLSMVIGVLTAYLAHHTLAPGASFGAVLRITGVVAIAAYALGDIQTSIWKGVPWRVSLKFMGDGIAYGLTTAVVFAWLWPAAV